MMTHRTKGRKPQIVFTADFHLLVRGDCTPGTVILRYDPFRIVPAEEVSTLPATRRPITVACRFHPGGALWSGEMRFAKAGWLQADYDPTGQGTMLTIPVPFPEGSDEIELWFSYTDGDGQAHFDSADGKNLWVRFPTNDIETIDAKVSSVPNQPLDDFSIQVTSVPEVASLTVRWRYTAFPSQPRQQQPLAAEVGDDGKKTWTTPGGPSHVSSGTPLAFDLVYSVAGHVYTEDNEGNWHVVAAADEK